MDDRMMDMGGAFGGGGGRMNPMMGGMRHMQARMQRRK